MRMPRAGTCAPSAIGQLRALDSRSRVAAIGDFISLPVQALPRIVAASLRRPYIGGDMIQIRRSAMISCIAILGFVGWTSMALAQSGQRTFGQVSVEPA
jgi:hypothetical protein